MGLQKSGQDSGSTLRSVPHNKWHVPQEVTRTSTLGTSSLRTFLRNIESMDNKRPVSAGHRDFLKTMQPGFVLQQRIGWLGIAFGHAFKPDILHNGSDAAFNNLVQILVYERHVIVDLLQMERHSPLPPLRYPYLTTKVGANRQLFPPNTTICLTSLQWMIHRKQLAPTRKMESLNRCRSLIKLPGKPRLSRIQIKTENNHSLLSQFTARRHLSTPRYTTSENGLRTHVLSTQYYLLRCLYVNTIQDTPRGMRPPSILYFRHCSVITEAGPRSRGKICKDGGPMASFLKYL